MPNDRQAKTSALFGRLYLIHHTIKPLCQPGEMMRFHTAPIVFYPKQYASLFRPAVIPIRGPSGEQSHSEGATFFLAIPQSIFDKVQKHLNHLILIRPDCQLVLNGNFERTSWLIKPRSDLSKYNRHQICDFNQITGPLMLMSLDTRQIQQPVDQAFQPGRLLSHDLQKLLSRPFIHAAPPSSEGINEATQRRQRRTELMTGMSYEIDPHPVQNLRFATIREHDKHACMPVVRGRNSSQ